MNQTSKWVIRIVYTIIMVCICIAAIGAYLSVRIFDAHEKGGRYELVSAEAEKIGRTYEENTAPEGSSYYRVSVKVKNTGQYADRCGDIRFEITTDDEVICVKEYGDYDMFLWESGPIAPAGRTTEVENIVWVPDGREYLVVKFGADTDGKGDAKISLK